MRITHKVDYGVRACVALARALAEDPSTPVKRDRLAEAEAIPGAFLDDILRQLRNAEILRSHRGPEGGWSFAVSPEQVTVADVIRALEGPLASVRGLRPDELGADGVGEPFVSLWVAVRASLRSVLEAVTVADLASGVLPTPVVRLTEAAGAWESH